MEAAEDEAAANRLPDLPSGGTSDVQGSTRTESRETTAFQCPPSFAPAQAEGPEGLAVGREEADGAKLVGDGERRDADGEPAGGRVRASGWSGGEGRVRIPRQSRGLWFVSRSKAAGRGR
jgi:hypothetical protein